MDFFDSKVSEVKSYIDEINQEIGELKKVEHNIIIIYIIKHRKIPKRKNIYQIQ